MKFRQTKGEREVCLERITKRFLKSDKVHGIGYKVFREFTTYDRATKLLGECQGTGARPQGVWLHEKNFRCDFHKNIQVDKHLSYPFGWHIYCSRSAADIGWCSGLVVKKVKYRDARVIGTQDRKRIVVAKEIFIC
jgi:hypothetical protein